MVPEFEKARTSKGQHGEEENNRFVHGQKKMT
jgi:hypothetical protein